MISLRRRHQGHQAQPWPLLFGMLTTLSVACAQVGEGPGHRTQSLGLSPEQELSLGQQAYREILTKSQVEPASSADVQKVRRVGRAIARASQIEPLQREINLHLQGYTFDWEFNVLKDPHVNAFCLPGGKVAVYSGLPPVADSDDFLATVLSHEIAHALAHHASERIARQEKHRRLLVAANGILGAMDPQSRRELMGVLAAGTQLVGSLPYDRRQESEADHIGIFLMTFAGYDPAQALVFWQRMRQLSRRGHVPALLSDHPTDAQRIAQIEKWIPLAKAAKRAFDEGRIVPSTR
jgi:predicted Zn-dependent protease